MSGFSDLVGNGADCGPGNGMSGLMKQFNKDHSLEQDRFGPPAQASSSKQAFRQTFRQNTPVAAPNVMANEFLAQANRTQGPGSFNFAEMHREINGMQVRPNVSQGDWSADFARHQAAAPGGSNAELEMAFARAGPMAGALGPMHHMRPLGPQQAGWAEQFHRAAPVQAQSQAPVHQAQAPMRPDPMAMAFNEARMYSMMPGPGMMMHRPPMMLNQQHQQQQKQQQQKGEEDVQQPADTASQDDLAKTAAQILGSVRDTANPKFKKSEFFSFMQQLADGQATIKGDQVVTDAKGKQAEAGPTWASEFDQRAEDLINREAATRVGEESGTAYTAEFARGMERNWAEEFEQTLDGPLQETNVSGHPQDVDIKLDQPDSKYMHGEASSEWLEQFKNNIQPLLNDQDREWLDTQKEWENISSLETAQRAVDPALNTYTFQPNN
ncbi:hypothetical protein GGI07_005181, partial [Coemansia sp. Benny D115]